MSRKYELVYIVSPDSSEDHVADVHTQVAGIVERMGGRLETTEHWGRRKLAYEIGRHRDGIYVLEVIDGNGNLMKEIDRRLKVNDQIIRHLVVRVDREQAVIERTRSRRLETSRRRRLARGLPAERQPGEGQRSEPDEERERDERFDAAAEG